MNTCTEACVSLKIGRLFCWNCKESLASREGSEATRHRQSSLERFGNLHNLINGAGILPDGMVLESTRPMVCFLYVQTVDSIIYPSSRDSTADLISSRQPARITTATGTGWSCSRFLTRDTEEVESVGK